MMTEKSRNRFLALVAIVLLFFLCAAMVAGGYVLGRNAAQSALETRTAAAAAASEQSAGPEQAAPSLDPAENGSLAGAETEPGPVSGSSPEAAPAVDTPGPDTVQGQEDQTAAVQSEPSIPVELEPGDLDLLIEVWDIISSEFDGPLPETNDVIYEAIRGSLELLNDDNTRFVPPELAEQARQQLEGSFEGIGAFVDTQLSEEGYLVIVRPIDGQPAARAGLRNGDKISRVDGESVVGLSVDAIIALVKGPRGTDVTLTIVREGDPEPFDVAITRAFIEIPIVTSMFLDEGIAYVRLDRFSSNASEQLSAALVELLAQDPVGLILDLRDNPGGLLNQAVEVSDLFLAEGVVLYERDSSQEERVFRSDSGDLAENLPLVVLVNIGSASASEILAGAVQDRGRGIIVGEQTFGKGSVQNVRVLSDDSELRVTIARWYTPNNTSIDREGVTPDVEVPTPDEFGTENDGQLRRAIELILEG
jgi:carboxyl-terminal processing protease